MKFFKENWFTLLLLLVVTLLILRDCNRVGKKIDPNQAAYEYLQDSVKFFKNKAGEATAQLNLLVLDNEKQLEQIESKDKRIAELKYAYNKVKKDLKAKDKILNITLIELENFQSGKMDTVYVVKSDTIFVDGEAFIIHPQYKFSTGDEWHLLEGVVGEKPENSYYNLSIKEKLELSYVRKSLGFLGMKGTEYQLQAVSLNPYTTSIDLNGFSINEKVKRFHVGAFAGYGVTNQGLSPNISIGLMYSIFSF